MGNSYLLLASWVMTISSPPICRGAVAIQDDRIVDVGPQEELLERYPHFKRESFPDAVLLPGFVNAHSHVAHTSLKNMVSERSFALWLEQMVRRMREKPLSPSQIKSSAKAGFMAALRSGVTTFADSSPYPETLEVFASSGARGIFYLEVFSFLGRDPDQLARKSLALVKRLRKKLPPRLQIGLSPHSPYTAHPQFLRDLVALCAKEKIPLALHVAESAAETQFFQEGNGALARLFPGRAHLIPRARSPIQYLESLGVLKTPLLAAHCVHVDKTDLEIMKQRKIRVAVCPESNAWLRVGQPPARQFLRRRLTVGLGTDSAASCPTLDFFHTLRQAKTRLGLSARQVVELATLGGAAALGLQKVIGSIEPGKQADLIALRCRPCDGDPYALVLRRGRPENVLRVMVAGQTLLET